MDDSHITKLASIYQVSEKQIKDKYSPEYDIKQGGNHAQIPVPLCGQYLIDIDEKIVPIITKVNSYFEYPVTVSSCQHNHFGYACIQFSIEGYKKWIDLISGKIKRRYCRLCKVPEDYTPPEEAWGEPLMKRFSRDHDSSFDPHPYIAPSFACFWCDGRPGLEVIVNWRFVQSEIPTIMQELCALLDEEELSPK